MVTAIGPFFAIWARTDVPADPPLIGPVRQHVKIYKNYLILMTIILFHVTMDELFTLKKRLIIIPNWLELGCDIIFFFFCSVLIAPLSWQLKIIYFWNRCIPKLRKCDANPVSVSLFILLCDVRNASNGVREINLFVLCHLSGNLQSVKWVVVFMIV
jgi:hypothetical protein